MENVRFHSASLFLIPKLNYYMSHSINFMGIKESTFILLNLCHASESIARTYDLASEPGSSWLDSAEYEAYLIHSVSELLVKISINSRIWLDEFKRFEDQSRNDDGFEGTQMNDSDLVEALEFGIQTDNHKKIGVRAACNKIIHAEKIELVLTDGEGIRNFIDDDTDRTWRYWSGHLTLQGHLYDKPWEIDLDVPSFCLALDTYLETLARDFSPDYDMYSWVV